MLKRFTSLRRFPLYAIKFTPKFPIFTLPQRGFANTFTNVLAEHQREIKMMEYHSTQMQDPSKIQKADTNEWDEKGFLTQMKEYTKDMEIYEVGGVPDLPGKNTPSGSWVRFKFPLEKNLNLRAHFQRFFNQGIRVGRILEIMDYVAATVAYRYCKEEPKVRKVTMATASVIDMSLFEGQINSSRDLQITGYVCYVGKTSMEIRVDIAHSNDPMDQIGSAYFMFVARDANEYSKAYPLPELSFEGEDDMKKCMLRFEYGRKNKERKIHLAAKSVFKVAPSSEESTQLHDLFIKTLDPKALENFTPISKTQREKLILMHIQDKNMHGKVFGGYVMKEAVELGWATAFLNGDGTYPIYVHIDDVAFLRAIPVGSITNFRARVTYIEENLIHVRVSADNVKDNNTEERVFEVNIIFSVKENPKPVIPTTYLEGMLYLEGKRRVNNLFLL